MSSETTTNWQLEQETIRRVWDETYKDYPRVWVVEITNKYSSHVLGVYDKLSLAEIAFEKRPRSDMGAILYEQILNMESVSKILKQVDD